MGLGIAGGSGITGAAGDSFWNGGTILCPDGGGDHMNLYRC